MLQQGGHKEMYSKINEKTIYVKYNKDLYCKQSRTVLDGKRKIHKDVAEFYLHKNILAKRSKQKFRSENFISFPLLGTKSISLDSERSRGLGAVREKGVHARSDRRGENGT
jgi:hypothetical protein